MKIDKQKLKIWFRRKLNIFLTGYPCKTTDGNYPCPKENMTDLDLYEYELDTYFLNQDRRWPTFQHFLNRDEE